MRWSTGVSRSAITSRCSLQLNMSSLPVRVIACACLSSPQWGVHTYYLILRELILSRLFYLAGRQLAEAAPGNAAGVAAAPSFPAADAGAGQRRALGIPGGRLPLLRGRPSLLVLYHYFERESTCAEDEEIAIMRTNLLYFLRCRPRCPKP